LEAGASRKEIVCVLECAGFLSFNVFTLAAPIILEEASEGALDAAGVACSKRLKDAGGVMPADARSAVEKVEALLIGPKWTQVAEANKVTSTLIN
jgi:hypothetical protein